MQGNKFSAAASSSSNSAVQSPSLSPASSRPSTPSPPTSTSLPISPSSSASNVENKFACSALEVSQPQIDGKVWITDHSIEFEGMFKDQKRTVKVALTAILAIKKSWGMFGGDGIDIYAAKDVIVFYRHFQPNTRDTVYDALVAAIKASGLSVILK